LQLAFAAAAHFALGAGVVAFSAVVAISGKIMAHGGSAGLGDTQAWFFRLRHSHIRRRGIRRKRIRRRGRRIHGGIHAGGVRGAGVRTLNIRSDKSGLETKLVPIADATQIAIGDEVEVHLLLRARADMDYVHLRDPRAAGFEPSTNTSRHQWDFGIAWYEEVRDSGTNFFFERVPRGEYTLKYRVRASMVGTFKVAPATAQPMYAPEFAAFSAGDVVRVQDPARVR
jgi:hypothetical protein